jgi:hypothetical protein
LKTFWPLTRALAPWIVGIIVAVLAIRAVGMMEGPATCNDGWHSMSIGRQGACSHHGGVRGSWAAILGVGAGGIFGWVTAVLLTPKPPSTKPPIPILRPPPPTPIAPSVRHSAMPSASQIMYSRYCDQCSGGMRAINVSLGSGPHGPFWECLSCGALVTRKV